MRKLLVRGWSCVGIGVATCLASAWIALPVAAALALTGVAVAAGAVLAVEILAPDEG